MNLMNYGKKLKSKILLSIAIILAVFLVLNKLVIYGFILLSISVGFYLLWTSYIKGLFSELKISKDKIEALNSENVNLKRAKVNIVGIEEILELCTKSIQLNLKCLLTLED